MKAKNLVYLALLTAPLSVQAQVTYNEKGQAVPPLTQPFGAEVFKPVEHTVVRWLDLKTRELRGYCIQTTIEAESQLRSHLLGNQKADNSKETVTTAVIPCMPYIVFPSAIKTLKIIEEASQTQPDTKNNIVRLSKITVDPAQLDAYNAFLKEEIEASMRLEPGVLSLYATSEKEHPNKVTILEIYADQEAYKSHIQTPHFRKYKQGTLKMVQELELVDSNPLIPGLKIK